LRSGDGGARGPGLSMPHPAQDRRTMFLARFEISGWEILPVGFLVRLERAKNRVREWGHERT
jgi:hypothetical protein